MTSAVVAVGILVAVALPGAAGASAPSYRTSCGRSCTWRATWCCCSATGTSSPTVSSCSGPGLARDYWLGLYLVVIACLIWGRLVAPLWLNLRHRFRVAEVVDEGRDIISIYLSGRNLQPGRPGRPVLPVAVPGRRPVDPGAPVLAVRRHAIGRWLRLTVKAVGRHTSALRDLRPGVRVWAQGPMGSFTAVRRTRGRALLIAGGSGIGPIRALLEELPPGASVIYRASTPAEVVLREELDRIAEIRHADVWYVIGSARRPRPAGDDDRLRDAADRARRGAAATRTCAAREGFIKGARRALRAAGVPAPPDPRDDVRDVGVAPGRRPGRMIDAAGDSRVDRDGGRHDAAHLAQERAGGEPAAGAGGRGPGRGGGRRPRGRVGRRPPPRLPGLAASRCRRRTPTPPRRRRRRPTGRGHDADRSAGPSPKPHDPGRAQPPPRSRRARPAGPGHLHGDSRRTPSSATSPWPSRCPVGRSPT